MALTTESAKCSDPIAKIVSLLTERKSESTRIDLSLIWTSSVVKQNAAMWRVSIQDYSQKNKSSSTNFHFNSILFWFNLKRPSNSGSYTTLTPFQVVLIYGGFVLFFSFWDIFVLKNKTGLLQFTIFPLLFLSSRYLLHVSWHLPPEFTWNGVIIGLQKSSYPFNNGQCCILNESFQKLFLLHFNKTLMGGKRYKLFGMYWFK